MEANKRKIIGIAIILSAAAIIFGIVLFSIFGSSQIEKNINQSNNLNFTIKISAPELDSNATSAVARIQQYEKGTDFSNLMEIYPKQEWFCNLQNSQKDFSLDLNYDYLITLVQSPINPDGSFYHFANLNPVPDKNGEICAQVSLGYSKLVNKDTQNKEIYFELSKVIPTSVDKTDSNYKKDLYNVAAAFSAIDEVEYCAKTFGLTLNSYDEINTEEFYDKASNYLFNNSIGSILIKEFGSSTEPESEKKKAILSLKSNDTYIAKLIKQNEDDGDVK